MLGTQNLTSGKRDMPTDERMPTSQTKPAAERTVKAPREKPKKNSSSPVS
jgi:hypothetical protein